MLHQKYMDKRTEISRLVLVIRVSMCKQMYSNIILIIVTLTWDFSTQNHRTLINVPEDGILNFTRLANKYHGEIYEYDVITHDGYILKLFNIRGDKRKPVFLMHGFLDSSDTFILRGEDSPAITLARAGYDVWVGNARGNKYSRHHLTLNPDEDQEYWDFCLHEIGYYDLPKMIDFILDETDNLQIQAIGHSAGATVFFILGSTRPEYNAKINVLISLGPICYLQNINTKSSALAEFGTSFLSGIIGNYGVGELFNEDNELYNYLDTLCSGLPIGFMFCTNTFVHQVYGSDTEEFELAFSRIAVAHQPGGTSAKTAIHFLQMAIRRKFSQYDYGENNYAKYKSYTPPEYDLEKVDMKVTLFLGRNDKLSLIKDAKILRRRLPNVVEYKVMERKKFNHLDFIYGKNMKIYLFPHILRILDKYKSKTGRLGY